MPTGRAQGKDPVIATSEHSAIATETCRRHCDCLGSTAPTMPVWVYRMPRLRLSCNNKM